MDKEARVKELRNALTRQMGLVTNSIIFFTKMCNEGKTTDAKFTEFVRDGIHTRLDVALDTIAEIEYINRLDGGGAMGVVVKEPENVL